MSSFSSSSSGLTPERLTFLDREEFVAEFGGRDADRDAVQERYDQSSADDESSASMLVTATSDVQTALSEREELAAAVSGGEEVRACPGRCILFTWYWAKTVIETIIRKFLL